MKEFENCIEGILMADKFSVTTILNEFMQHVNDDSLKIIIDYRNENLKSKRLDAIKTTKVAATNNGDDIASSDGGVQQHVDEEIKEYSINWKDDLVVAIQENDIPQIMFILNTKTPNKIARNLLSWVT